MYSSCVTSAEQTVLVFQVVSKLLNYHTIELTHETTSIRPEGLF